MSAQDLRAKIEPLVDAISTLVVAAVTDDLSVVKSSCEDIASYTREAVEIAKDQAIASNDVDVQIDITKAINDLATAIEALITSFTMCVSNPNNDSKRTFSRAAKETGEAINALILSTDQTYLRKLTEAVAACKTANKQLIRDCTVSREALVKAAQKNAEETVKLVKIGTKAAKGTIDEQKGELIGHETEKIKALGPALIQAAKVVHQNPSDGGARGALDRGNDDLDYTYEKLLEYARMMGSYIGKVNEAWENAQRLLELARQLRDAADALRNAALHGSRDDLIAAAKRAAALAQQLIEKAIKAAEFEKDPVRKQMLLAAIEELRRAAKELIEAAKLAHENPTPQNLERLDRAHARLGDAIARVLALTDPDQSPASRFYYTAQFLEDTAGQCVDEANAADALKLAEDARLLAAVALQFVREAEELAKTIVDPDQRRKLVEAAKIVKGTAHELIDQANVVVKDPKKEQEVKKLKDLYDRLKDELDDARRLAGFHVSRPKQYNPTVAKKPEPVPEPAPEPVNIRMLEKENELVTAAKQQAVEALQIAEEAERFAHTLKDEKRKNEILDACKELRKWAHTVIERAEAVAADPKDEEKQKQMFAAQKELGKHVARVIGLTVSAQDELAAALRELEALLAESEGMYSELFAACKACQDEIDTTFVKGKSRKAPAEIVAAAKRLADHTNNINRLLKEIANKQTDAKDRQYKNQLMEVGKILRDRAIQVKMLSAVKAAMTGDEVDDNQVASAAVGMSTEITQLMKNVRTAMLKRRLQSTVSQTAALRKIREAWLAQRTKVGQFQ